MLRRMLLLLILALLLLTGAAVWASTAPHTYQGTVYYRRAAVSDNSPYWSLGPDPVIQEWIDRRNRRDRIRISGLARPIERLTRDGHAYDSNAATQQFFAGSVATSWIQWLFGQGCGVAPRADATVRLDIGSGYVATVQCEPYRRLAPGALPADFFDPPHRSIQNAVLGWVQQHLPARSG